MIAQRSLVPSTLLFSTPPRPSRPLHPVRLMVRISHGFSVISFFLYFLISQERNLSAAMERRCFALLSACSTAMLILSNLMFLGGTHVGRVFWKRVFVQGKLPSATLSQWDLYLPLLVFAGLSPALLLLLSFFLSPALEYPIKYLPSDILVVSHNEMLSRQPAVVNPKNNSDDQWMSDVTKSVFRLWFVIQSTARLPRKQRI